jgi:acetyltransferase-like isoleucine patch superfamily enzyme
MKHHYHPTADVQSFLIGPNTRTWRFVVVLPKARIGSDGNICSDVFIENDVIVSDRVTGKFDVQLWGGLRIEDDVFIGSNATFANDPFPRSKHFPSTYLVITFKAGAAVGIGAVLLPRVTFDRNARVGAVAMVTKSVLDSAVAVGNSARFGEYI